MEEKRSGAGGQKSEVERTVMERVYWLGGSTESTASMQAGNQEGG